MNVLVNDVAADSSGALSVLMDFYREVINSNEDTLQWYFVVSIPQLLEYKNVHVSRYPWVKKSWLHRLFFEYFVIPRIIRRNNIKCLVSLQNTSTVFKRVLTILYIHQSLPFSSYRFKFYKNPKLWIYQNIIGKLIKKSIKKANIVITQTETMREECAKYSLPNSEKFRVISPNLSIEPKDHFKPSKENLRVFFYPATPLNYKNHALIIEAFSKLSDSDIQDYQVIFTFERDDTRLTKRLYKKAEKLKVPIELVGHLSRERVFDYYCKSILLFPSFIESYPLPLYEGMLHKTIIIAADCEFSREILGGYPNAYYFDPSSSESLLKILELLYTEKIEYQEHFDPLIEEKRSSLVTKIRSLLD